MIFMFSDVPPPPINTLDSNFTQKCNSALLRKYHIPCSSFIAFYLRKIHLYSISTKA